MAGLGHRGDGLMRRLPSCSEIIGTARAEVCLPWLRHILPQAEWAALADAAVVEGWILMAHWADTLQVHALFLDPEALAVVPVSTPVEAGRYPALSPALPAAALYERMIRDLWGHEAAGSADLRPWLDHGAWPDAHPMSVRPLPSPGSPVILGDDADTGDMILASGPLTGLIEEAAYLRLTVAGPVIRRAESLLGFSHRGTLALMRGKAPRNAARFAARLSANATVAHSRAFAAAAEAALDTAPPPRASALRLIMLETERIAVHLDSLAEVARLADAQPVWTLCLYLRETVLRACQSAFGHRLMMDCVVPGGLAADVAGDGLAALADAVLHVAAAMPEVRRLHGQSALRERLTGVGRIDGALAARFAAGGPAGRAAGRGFDSRCGFIPDYVRLIPNPALAADGDAAARQEMRMADIGDSIRLIRAALESLPGGPVSGVLPQNSGEGIGCAESAAGDIWHWIRLDHGQIMAVFPRDPGWALWPLAVHALENAPVEDSAIILASLALPVSGMDL